MEFVEYRLERYRLERYKLERYRLERYRLERYRLERYRLQLSGGAMNPHPPNTSEPGSRCERAAASFS